MTPALALAVLVGISLGLLGGGGSILAVPIFVYVAHLEPRQSVALSLLVVGAVSLLGAIQHFREGRVRIPVALGFGLWAMAGTWGGTRLAMLLSGSTQLVIFAFVMLAAAVSMFRRSRSAEPEGERKAHPVLAGVLGVAVGILTGIVGVGGGFLIVPALVLLARLPMHEAVGTSLLVIALNSGVGFLGYLQEVPVPWAFALAFIALAGFGTALGSRLAGAVSAAVLKRWFAVFLLVMALGILFERRSVFLGL